MYDSEAVSPTYHCPDLSLSRLITCGGGFAGDEAAAARRGAPGLVRDQQAFLSSDQLDGSLQSHCRSLPHHALPGRRPVVSWLWRRA